ncbi:MAG: NAD(P)H-dependent glycerol-3-phosphate dehydrogenase [Clostridia bacterium]|nr:NAD(P)H-dependent glycerol-3-phosphate dehydrogenase [Clostridia bacterium]
MKIGVIGAGSWGLALAGLLIDNGHAVKVWSRNSDETTEINEKHELKRYLPGVIFSEELRAYTDMAEVVKDSEVIVLAVPSVAVRECAKKLKLYLTTQIVVNVAKGIEAGSLKRLSEVIREEIGSKNEIAVLSGPSHAEEVAKRMPTVVAVAAEKEEVRDKISDIFMNQYFRVYPNSDMLGVEIGGAVKNVIALCAGASDGLGFGDNTKAGLITRGLAEILRLGLAMGGKPETFYGLTGIGDLVVTCASRHSRNHKAGELIGKGYSLEDALKEVNMVVEGVNAAKSIRELGKRYHVELPITEQACNVLFEGKDPKTAVLELMGRSKKKEV